MDTGKVSLVPIYGWRRQDWANRNPNSQIPNSRSRTIPPPSSMEEGEACHGLQRPPELDDVFTEEGWALMSEAERRQMIEIMNRKEVITDTTHRIHKKFIAGNGPPNLILPDGTAIRSLRIFTDPNAARKLVNIANKYHWEKEREQREALRRTSERKEREALLRKKEREQRKSLLTKSEREQMEALLIKQFDRAFECEDDDGCSAVGTEDKGQKATPDACAGSERYPAAGRPPSP